MAILDKELVFCSKTAVTAGVLGAPLDLSAGGDAIGQELTLFIVANTAITGGAVSYSLHSADTYTAGATGNVSTAVANGCLIQSAVMNATANPGDVLFSVRLPKGIKRYLWLVASAAATSGTITAYISKEL